MEKNDTIKTVIATLAIVAVFAILAVGICYTSTHQAENHEAENQDGYIECGGCGAHVHDWWYVENANNGKLVEVCEFCYSNYIENTAAED